MAIHKVLLAALHAHRLLRASKTGTDSTVLEANASLRALEHRNTEKSFWDYVRKLAEEAGIEPADTKAVRRFDRKREGRKTSNQDWQNPHDPEPKVGRTKGGATDMTYEPEHVTDLESGAIVRVEVQPGDATGDDASLCERVKEAVVMLGEALPREPVEKLGGELCADEGYFAVEHARQLQAYGMRTLIGDPHAGRRKPEKATKEQRAALNYAKRSVRNTSGKAPLRKRGRTLRTQLLPHARSKWAEAGHVARLRRADQATHGRSHKLQLESADTSVLRDRNALQAMAASQARLIAASCWLSCLATHLFAWIIGFCGVIQKYFGSISAFCCGPQFSGFSTCS